MKSFILRKSIILLVILTPLILDMGCKKQKKCGCGKDVIFDLPEGAIATIIYIPGSKSAYFYQGASSYTFCNPGKWSDFLSNYPQAAQTGQDFLITGKVYYDCTYLMNSGNYGYYIPPAYQIDVTSLAENNYSKK